MEDDKTYKDAFKNIREKSIDVLDIPKFKNKKKQYDIDQAP